MSRDTDSDERTTKTDRQMAADGQHQHQRRRLSSPATEATATGTTSIAPSPALTTDEGGERGLHLKRQLGLLHGVAIVSGLVIGGGIYISPKGVVRFAGSPGLSLVLWGVGGLLSMLGALTYAEIGIVMPVAGEKYAYLEKLFGPFIAFLYLWLYLFFIRTGGNTVKALMFGRYVLKPFFPDCDIPPTAILLVATSMAAFLTLINCFSVKFSAKGQNVMTAVSMTTLAIISVSGAVWIFQGNAISMENAFEGSSSNVGDLTLAIHSTVYTYYGWTALNFLVEELKKPERNLPLSIAISIFLTTVLYVFVNLSYLAVIGIDGVLTSEAVAISTTFQSLGRLAWIVPILIAITACSSFNAGIMCGSRMAFAGARRGQLPSVLQLISVKFVTPITSLILQGVLVFCFVWTIEVYRLINNLVCGMLAFDALVVFGYIRYRIRNPQILADKQFKLPLIVPISYFVLCLFLVGVPMVTNPMESMVGLALSLGTAIPYYVIVIKWFNKTNRKSKLHRMLDEFKVFVQKILYSAPEGDHGSPHSTDPTPLKAKT